MHNNNCCSFDVIYDTKFLVKKLRLFCLLFTLPWQTDTTLGNVCWIYLSFPFRKNTFLYTFFLLFSQSAAYNNILSWFNNEICSNNWQVWWCMVRSCLRTCLRKMYEPFACLFYFPVVTSQNNWHYCTSNARLNAIMCKDCYIYFTDEVPHWTGFLWTFPPQTHFSHCVFPSGMFVWFKTLLPLVSPVRLYSLLFWDTPSTSVLELPITILGVSVDYIVKKKNNVRSSFKQFN